MTDMWGNFEEEFIEAEERVKIDFGNKLFILDGDRYNKWVVQSQHKFLDKLTLAHYMDKTLTREMWINEFKRCATEVIF